jgi:hypothetical protein
MEELELLRSFMIEHRVTLWVVLSVFVAVHISIGIYRVKTERVDGTWKFWKKLLLLDLWGYVILFAFEFGIEALATL